MRNLVSFFCLVLILASKNKTQNMKGNRAGFCPSEGQFSNAILSLEGSTETLACERVHSDTAAVVHRPVGRRGSLERPTVLTGLFLSVQSGQQGFKSSCQTAFIRTSEIELNASERILN